MLEIVSLLKNYVHFWIAVERDVFFTGDTLYLNNHYKLGFLSQWQVQFVEYGAYESYNVILTFNIFDV